MRLPDELRETLDNTGLPWDVKLGTKHNKVTLCGRLVAVFPRGRKQEHDKRVLLNTISQVRNAARELKEIR